MNRPPFSLVSKTAVITGGASGIGFAIAKRFAQHGCKIDILDIQPESLTKAVQELEEAVRATQNQSDHAKSGDRAICGEVCDVGDPVSVKEAFEKIVGRRNRIDILVNNAGIAHIGSALSTSPEDFARVQRVNVGGVANCTQAALANMVGQGGGVILNIASTVAQFGLADRFAYTASKGAVLAMTYSIARDFLEHGVRCNALLPGRIHTPFVDQFIAKNYAGKEEEMFEKLSKAQPIGRMGTPDEVASIAQFLCSEEASFITGAGYAVDGGVLTLR